MYFKDRLIPEREARVWIFCDGFLYARGLFETMRAYRGEVFALKQHIERLKKGAKIIGLKNPPPYSRLEEAVLITVGSSKIKEAYIRLNLWQEENSCNFACFIKPLKKYPDKFYKRGVRAIISDFKVNESSLLCRVKSLNYLFYKLARQAANKKNAFEAILLNSKGLLAEGAHSNIFLVKRDSLITPSLESGCLPGITRSIVLGLAKKEKIKVEEKLVKPGKLFKADEAFLTNSLIEIMPVTRVNNKSVNNGRSGKITNLLIKRYQELVKGS
ncbi:MAG: aminotransferase class IV [Candidatus Omnitrophota bacterium]